MNEDINAHDLLTNTLQPWITTNMDKVPSQSPDVYFNECQVASRLFQVEHPVRHQIRKSMNTVYMDNAAECNKMIRKYTIPHTVVDAFMIFAHHSGLQQMSPIVVASLLHTFFSRLLQMNHDPMRVFQFVATLIASKRPTNLNVSSTGRSYIKTLSSYELTCGVICSAGAHFALDTMDMCLFTCIMDQASPYMDHAITELNGHSLYGRVLMTKNLELFECMVVQYHFYPYLSLERLEDNPMMYFTTSKLERIMSLLSLPDRQMILMECTMCIFNFFHYRLTRKIMRMYIEDVGIVNERAKEVSLCVGLDYASIPSGKVTIDMHTPIQHRLRCLILHIAKVTDLHHVSDYNNQDCNVLVRHLEELVKHVMLGIPAILQFDDFVPNSNLKKCADTFLERGLEGFVGAWFAYCRTLSMNEEDTINIALCLCMWHLYRGPATHDEYFLAVSSSLAAMCSSDEHCTLKRLVDGILPGAQFVVTEKDILMTHTLIMTNFNIPDVMFGTYSWKPFVSYVSDILVRAGDEMSRFFEDGELRFSNEAKSAAAIELGEIGCIDSSRCTEDHSMIRKIRRIAAEG